MKPIGLVAVWGTALSLGGAVAWLVTRPDPPDPPVPPAVALRAAPPARRLHPVDLTLVRARDEALVASTSPDVKPQPVEPDDVLYLVVTTELTRPLYARAFVLDAGGRVVELSDDLLEWSAPSDGGLPPVHRLPTDGLRGDLRLRAYLSWHRFRLDRSDVLRAVARSGRSPIAEEPLPIPPPPGPAGASFGEASLLVKRSSKWVP